MKQSKLIDRITDDIWDINNINDLNVISSELKGRRKSLARKVGNTLQRGDKVRVSSGRSIEHGEIIKVNITRAVVRIDNQQWNVPFSMITKQ